MNNGILVQSQNQLIVSNGLVSYWSFNDGAGTTALDFSGNRNNGTMTSTVSWADGRIGGGLKFVIGTGITSSVNVAANSTYIDTPACSYTAWVKAVGFTAASTYCTIIGKKEVATLNYFVVFARNTGRLACYCYGNANISYDNTGTAMVVNTWYHVAMTYSSADGLRGYLNGVQDGTAAANGTIKVSGGTAAIGSYFPNYMDRGWNGWIDDVRVYNRAITAAEVQQLYLARGT